MFFIGGTLWSFVWLIEYNSSASSLDLANMIRNLQLFYLILLVGMLLLLSILIYILDSFEEINQVN